MDRLKDYIASARQVGFVMNYQNSNASEIKQVKSFIQESYTTFGTIYPDKIFLNLGLWDRKIYQEYKALKFDFSKISPIQDVYSPLLLYFLIRPLLKMQLFNRRLLEIGCGNGLGLRASSELLKTDYALGIDLTNQLVTHAHHNYYSEDKINYIQSDAERLPIESESFDLVTNLESSHLYPSIELFFTEVERVLRPQGYFCYADHYYKPKDQSTKLERFIKQQDNLKIIQKINITKMVQAALYQRLIVNEDSFYKYASDFLIGSDPNKWYEEFCTVAATFGLIFLPWWKIRFKNPILRPVAKYARNEKFWGKKYYFYYLIQKVKK
ncbi:class I SAM-dependent methyltransferase [Legionella sp. km772]|uniref:class I SAM-dependent methyltransferase n=1 Tax=Legionella sp. km772 TaxID=2498111 RepID=UPI000F8DBE3F|nr:class I SAM-dependent methyltransferase [Legionella sp. km772]RUR05118.1 SAM-dependent methyltransferase [Legionella sp. km772]